MAIELLATCWTHAGDAMPIAGRHLSPLDLRVRARAVAAAGFTGIGFTIDDLEAAKATYGLPLVKQICEDLGLVVHLEVELLENWWTTDRRRRESDETRASLLAAAEVLEAQEALVDAHRATMALLDNLTAHREQTGSWSGCGPVNDRI
jgi:sugar phosphate isomerase/epimerase